MTLAAESLKKITTPSYVGSTRSRMGYDKDMKRKSIPRHLVAAPTAPEDTTSDQWRETIQCQGCAACMILECQRLVVKFAKQAYNIFYKLYCQKIAIRVSSRHDHRLDRANRIVASDPSLWTTHKGRRLVAP